MIIDKNYAGLKKVLGIYQIDDDIISDGELEICLPKPLAVTGRVIAKHGIIIDCPSFAVNKDIVSQKGAIFATGHIVSTEGQITASIIRVEGSILTLGAVNAKEFIEVKRYIRCNSLTVETFGVSAGEDITVNTFIKCKTRIFAGMDPRKLEADCIKTVQCAELREGEVTHGDLILSRPG